MSMILNSAYNIMQNNSSVFSFMFANFVATITNVLWRHLRGVAHALPCLSQTLTAGFVTSAVLMIKSCAKDENIDFQKFNSINSKKACRLFISKGSSVKTRIDLIICC